MFLRLRKVLSNPMSSKNEQSSLIFNFFFKSYLRNTAGNRTLNSQSETEHVVGGKTESNPKPNSKTHPEHKTG